LDVHKINIYVHRRGACRRNRWRSSRFSGEMWKPGTEVPGSKSATPSPGRDGIIQIPPCDNCV